MLRSHVCWGHLEAEFASYDTVNMKIRITNIFTRNFKEFFQKFSVLKLPLRGRVTADSRKSKRQKALGTKH